MWNGTPKGITYRNVALWAYAILEGFKSGAEGLPRWDEITDDQNGRIADAFLSVAVANIKKSGGRSVSQHDDLLFFAQNDGDLLRRQVDLINPDLVIAGHVWYLVKNQWPDSKPLYDSVHQHNQTVFVDFWHPASHNPEQMKYYALDAFLRGSMAFSVLRTVKNHAD